MDPHPDRNTPPPDPAALQKERLVSEMNRQICSLPFGVMVLTLFYGFGAFGLVYFFIASPDTAARSIAIRHGLPATTGSWILPVVAALALLISYGLFSRSRWGYSLTLLYQIYFGGISLYLYLNRANLLYFGNLIWSVLVIIYLLLARNCFTVRQADRFAVRNNQPGQI